MHWAVRLTAAAEDGATIESGHKRSNRLSARIRVINSFRLETASYAVTQSRCSMLLTRMSCRWLSERV